MHDNDETQSESNRESNSTEKCANEHEQLTKNDVKSCNNVDAKLEFELQRDRDVYEERGYWKASSHCFKQWRHPRRIVVETEQVLLRALSSTATDNQGG